MMENTLKILKSKAQLNRAISNLSQNDISIAKIANDNSCVIAAEKMAQVASSQKSFQLGLFQRQHPYNLKTNKYLQYKDREMLQ